MIYGHSFAQNLLSKLIQDLQNGNSTPAFVLLVGPDHIGKRSLLRDSAMSTHIWENDICVLHDVSGIGDYAYKIHTIKIQTTDAGKMPTLINQYHQIVYDYGVREMQSRFSLSPLATCKLVLIHNIHRLTSAASNAMLKILEEPLEHRMIIATTDNTSALLPTIISRAQCLYLHASWDDILASYLSDHYPQLSLKTRDYITQMSWSTIGIATMLASWEQTDVEQYYHDCKKIASATILEIYQILQSYAQKGSLNYYLTLLQSYTDIHRHYCQTSAIAQYQTLVQASVNAENALINLAFQLVNHI